MFDGLLGRSATGGDPETTSTLDVPEVEVPDTSDVDVPPAVSHLFWRLVVTVDVAVLFVCVGAMFVYFRGRWQLGLTGIGLGLITFGYAYLRYRVAEPVTDSDP